MKRWLKRLAIFLGVMAVLIVAFYVEENWRGAREWAKVSAELKAKGYPLTVSDIIPPPVPDADNVAAAPIFAELFAADGQENKKAQLLEIEKLNSNKSDVLSCLIFGKAGDLRSYYQQPPFTMTEREAAQKILAELDNEWTPVLAEVAEALKRPQCRRSLPYENIVFMRATHIMAQLDMSSMLRFRATAYLAAGENQKTLADIETLLSLARMNESYPTLVGLFMAMSNEQRIAGVIWDGLLKEQWRAGDLEKIQAQLSQAKLLADIRNSFCAERVTIFHICDFVKNWQKLRNFLAIQRYNHSLSSALAFWLRPRGWNDLDRCCYAYFSENLLDSLDLETGLINVEKVKQVNAEVDNYFSKWTNLVVTPMTKLYYSEIASNLYSAAKTQTQINEAIIACALERYRLANSAVPDDLSALVPEYLDQLPMQVVNGEPFIYRKVSVSDYILYSIGWNLRDDGGKWAWQQDQGDWVWASKPELYQELK